MKLSTNKTTLRKQLVGELAHEKLDSASLMHISKVFFGKENAITFFGMNAKKLTEEELKLNARTAAESTIDIHAKKIIDLISKDLEALGVKEFAFIDAFAGAGNITYQVIQSLKPSKIIASDKNPNIYATLKENFIALGVQPSPFFFGGDLLSNERLSAIIGDFPNVVIFIDAPWGEAYDAKKGLNLKKTRPGVDTIISNLKGKLPKKKILFVIKTHENLNQKIVDEIVAEGSLTKITQKTLTGTEKGSNAGYLSLTN